MVRPHNKQVLGSLKPVPPFLQGELYSQQLLIPNIIISLGRGPAAGEEGAGMKLLVDGRALGENRPGVGGINLHNKLSRRVRMDEDR